MAAGDLAKQEHTLESAVRAEVRAGIRDPVEITARLSEKYGQAWLLRQIVNVVARMAGVSGVPVTHVQRSGGPQSLETAATSSAAAAPPSPGLPRVRKAAGDIADDFFSSSRWVSPEIGWKRVVDLTADDCRAVAAQYELLSDVAGQHHRWFADAAAAIEQEGVATLGEVKDQLIAPSGELPAGVATL